MLRIDVESQTGVCNVAPTVDDRGIASAHITAPGDSGRSVLHARINSRNDLDMMPPLASSVIDRAGEQLVGAWSNSLMPASCQ